MRRQMNDPSSIQAWHSRPHGVYLVFAYPTPFSEPRYKGFVKWEGEKYPNEPGSVLLHTATIPPGRYNRVDPIKEFRADDVTEEELTPIADLIVVTI